MDHPPAHLATLTTAMAFQDRSVVRYWLNRVEPLVLRLPQDRHLMSDLEVAEIERFDLGRLGIHGVIDVNARTGTYFLFRRVAR